MNYNAFREYLIEAVDTRDRMGHKVRVLASNISNRYRYDDVMRDEWYKDIQEMYAQLGVALVDYKRAHDAVVDLVENDLISDILPEIPKVDSETEKEDEYI